MRLRNDNFRPVMNGSGARSFSDEGYPFHAIWKIGGLTWEHCGFTAKSTGMEERLSPKDGKGNMPLRKDRITPAELLPKCIVVDFHTGSILNAVGLSGPGLAYLLSFGRWQRRQGDPFLLSFASAMLTRDERLQELREFVACLKKVLWTFKTAVGLELNITCPNTGHDPLLLLNEAGEMLDIADELGIPLGIKMNVLMLVKTACEIACHPACNFIVNSNTIAFGRLPDCIPWHKIFGSNKSPLAHLGGGGLSSPYVLPVVCEWIKEARDCSVRVPIIASNGIQSSRDVVKVAQAGASGFQIGAVGIVRPRHMRSIIKAGNELFM